MNRCMTAMLAVSLFLAAPAVRAANAVEGQPASSTNPPPSTPLNTFKRFQIAAIAMGAPFAGQKGNEVAREKLQADLDERVQPVLAQWNAAEAGDAPKTLKIQPEIRYIRFITGGKRFFAGAMAGGSSILVKVKLSDAGSGEVVAEPDFYQHANAMGAAWSFGATDKTMLIRISNMITEYLKANYSQVVGSSVSEAPPVDN